MDYGQIDLANPVNRDHPLNRGLQAWYLVVPGLSGGRLFHDLVETSHGVLTSIGAGYGWRKTCRPGGLGEMSLDGGSATCVKAPDSAKFIFTNGLTVSCWVNYTSTTGSTRPFIFKALADSPWTGIMLSSDAPAHPERASMQGYNSSGASRYHDAVINDGLWHHVVGWYSGSQMGCVVDGIPAAPSSYSIGDLTSTEPVWLGNANAGWTHDPVVGSLDDVRIYGRVLSDAEIFGLYEHSKAGHPGTLNRFARSKAIIFGGAPSFRAGSIVGQISQEEPIGIGVY